MSSNSSKVCEEEILRAAEWLVHECFPNSRRNESAGLIAALQAALAERYNEHWYPDEPHRGCAFRALTCNGKLDPLLVQVAKASGVKCLQASALNFILWVNPGEIKVLWGNTNTKHVIYSAAGKPLNPYSKPQLHIEPTQMKVGGSLSGSPKLSALAQEFVPLSDHSDSESDGELPSQVEPPSAAHFVPPPPGLAQPLPAPPLPGVMREQWVPMHAGMGHTPGMAMPVGGYVPTTMLGSRSFGDYRIPVH